MDLNVAWRKWSHQCNREDWVVVSRSEVGFSGVVLIGGFRSWSMLLEASLSWGGRSAVDRSESFIWVCRVCINLKQ